MREEEELGVDEEERERKRSCVLVKRNERERGTMERNERGRGVVR
jgi:hypothetical protein